MAKRKNNRLLYILLGVVVLFVALAAIRGSRKPKGEKVAVEKSANKTIKETVEASGKVFPETEIKISSDVSGEVVELYVEEGDSVTAGQVLAKIDPDSYQSIVERGQASLNNAKAQVANSKAGVERAKAQKLQAKADVTRIEAQIENTRSIHDRNVTLHKDGIISDADFEASLSNLKTLEANLAAAKANMQSSQANLESAEQSVKGAQYTVQSAEATLKEMRTDLRRTTVLAPASGTVSMLNIEQGERVVGTGMMGGTELLRIANLNAMEVQVDVSENDVLRVALKDSVDIEVDAYLGRKFKGLVYQIANSATNSGTTALTSDQVTNFVVKIRIDPVSYQDLIGPNKKYPFRPGMSASVEINTHTEPNVLSVPIQSVTTREKEDKKKGKEGKFVKNDSNPEDEVFEVIFIAEADTVRMAKVKTGIQDDSYIQILEGLEEGEDVIIGPYSAVSKKLKEGDEIRIVDEEDLYKKDE